MICHGPKKSCARSRHKTWKRTGPESKWIWHFRHSRTVIVQWHASVNVLTRLKIYLNSVSYPSLQPYWDSEWAHDCHTQSVLLFEVCRFCKPVPPKAIRGKQRQCTYYCSDMRALSCCRSCSAQRLFSQHSRALWIVSSPSATTVLASCKALLFAELHSLSISSISSSMEIKMPSAPDASRFDFQVEERPLPSSSTHSTPPLAAAAAIAFL